MKNRTINNADVGILNYSQDYFPTPFNPIAVARGLLYVRYNERRNKK